LSIESRRNKLEYEKAFSEIEKNREFLIDTLRRMVRVNTSNPPGLNYDKLADVTETIFKSFGFKTERVISPFERIAAIKLPLKGDRVNLVATKGAGRPPVTIYAHMDVVPAPSAARSRMVKSGGAARWI
jgi:succinyl-diaminopimelate desuccinylase